MAQTKPDYSNCQTVRFILRHPVVTYLYQSIIIIQLGSIYSRPYTFSLHPALSVLHHVLSYHSLASTCFLYSTLCTLTLDLYRPQQLHPNTHPSDSIQLVSLCTSLILFHCEFDAIFTKYSRHKMPHKAMITLEASTSYAETNLG